MVKSRRLDIVILIGVLVVLLAMRFYSPAVYQKSSTNKQELKLVNFTGLCIYSSPGFSVLTNGEKKIAILGTLKTGTIYKVSGIMLNSTYGNRLKPVNISRTNLSALKLKNVTGVFWRDEGCYLLTPSRIKLAWCPNATKGTLLKVEGINYGHLFYPMNFSSKGYPKNPENGMPFLAEGIVIYTSPNAVIWNGTEEIRLYLPYHTHLKLGERVRVLGIVKFYSMLTIVVESPEDIKIIGEARKISIDEASIGDIAEGTCMVLDSGRAISLNCTTLKLYGFSAKRGDIVKFEAIRRKSSLYCLKCIVIASRNTLSNDICTPKLGKFGKIEGKVKWVRVYKNGFGLANITRNSCWVLLKLPKSMKISLRENQTITAFGTFTTYRGMPAFQVKSREDICSKRCS
ncbi:hypothetical protein [Thermococcus sp.]